jgi:rubredoxin
MSSINIMSFNTNRSFSCVFCGVEYNPINPDDIHIKANKYKINRDDIETIHECNECGKITKLYWSEQKGSN